MTIEKTFKLTIKATSFYLNATEINALYNECGKALNIGNTNPSYPPSVRKLEPRPICPTQPSDYPMGPQPSDYPSGPATSPNWPTGYPFGTTTDYPSLYCHSDMTTDNFEFDSNTSLNPKSSKGINFIKDDMTTIKDNTIKDSNNWRSSVQKSLDKLNAKTNVNWHSSVVDAINKLNVGSKNDNTTTKSGGTKVG